MASQTAFPGPQSYPMSQGSPGFAGNPQVSDYEFSVNITEDPAYEPKRQCLGYSIITLVSILFVIEAATKIYYYYRNYEFKASLVISSSAYLIADYFFIRILFDPKYCGGNPKLVNSWPLALYCGLNILSLTLIHPVKIFEMLGCVVATFIFYWVNFQDDKSDSCLLCLKPWVYKKIQIEAVHPYHHAPGQYPFAPSQSGPYSQPQSGQYTPAPFNPYVPFGNAPQLQSSVPFLPPPSLPHASNISNSPRGNPPSYSKR